MFPTFSLYTIFKQNKENSPIREPCPLGKTEAKFPKNPFYVEFAPSWKFTPSYSVRKNAPHTAGSASFSKQLAFLICKYPSILNAFILGTAKSSVRTI